MGETLPNPVVFLCSGDSSSVHRAGGSAVPSRTGTCGSPTGWDSPSELCGSGWTDAPAEVGFTPLFLVTAFAGRKLLVLAGPCPSCPPRKGNRLTPVVSFSPCPGDLLLLGWRGSEPSSELGESTAGEAGERSPTLVQGRAALRARWC